MKYTFRIALLLAVMVVGATVTVPTVAEEQGVDSTTTTRVDANSQILVWNAPALEPGRQQADNVGGLAYINGEGTLTPLSDVLAQSARVNACGPNALSPDGRHLALYQGNVGGVVSSLFLITDGAEPVLINDQFQPVSCVGGNGILTYSPDSSYMTYIEYEREFELGFADGFLRIVNTEDQSELFSERDVVAFEQLPDGVTFVRFFTNDENEADEVAMVFWDGNVDRELASFFIENEDCRFLNASISTAPDGLLWLGLVERCAGTTTFQVYRINPQERTNELILEQVSPGAFANSAQANNIWFSTDGENIIYTIPDGFTRQTVSLNAYSLTNLENTVLIDQQMVVGGVQGQAGNNDFSRVSPDGRFLITVVTNPAGNQNELRLFNLSDPYAAPLVIDAGGQGDIFPYIAFTRDGNRMIYVAGGVDNSLFMVDLTAENINPLRIRRGSFQGFATISPDGNEVAILDNQFPDEGLRGFERFVNLVVVNLNTSEVTTLFEGADVTDTDVENVRFAAPIFWFR